MPFYEYECKACGAQTEVLQKISDKPLRKCPECGKSALVKLVSAPIFRLKGGGWYETDFKSEQDRKRNLAGDEGDKKADTKADSGGDAKADSKAESKTESKTEAKAEGKAESKAEAKTAPKAESKTRARPPAKASPAKPTRSSKPRKAK